MSNKKTLQDNNAKLSNINETIKSLPNAYTLPIASPTELGGVKIGSGIEHLEDGTINVAAKYDDTQIKADLDKNTQQLDTLQQKILQVDTHINEVSQELATKANQVKSFIINVPTNNWSAAAPFVQTISVKGMTDKGVAFYDLISHKDKDSLKEFAKVTEVILDSNTITIECLEKKPLLDLNLRIEVLF